MMDMKLGRTRELIDACQQEDLLRNECAYVLATAFWETARTMQPVVEAYWLSEAWRKRNLRYYPWHGRGFVQLTWKENYIKAAKELGEPLDKDPTLALNPVIAAKIAVLGMKEGWFTRRKLSDFITLKKSDFVGARRIINGTDRAAEIAHIAKEYDDELLKMGYGVEEPEQEVILATTMPKMESAETETKPEVVLVSGPKADETTVVTVQHPQNPATLNPTPTSAKGFAVFGAMILAAVGGALKYFGVV